MCFPGLKLGFAYSTLCFGGHKTNSAEAPQKPFWKDLVQFGAFGRSFWTQKARKCRHVRFWNISFIMRKHRFSDKSTFFCFFRIRCFCEPFFVLLHRYVRFQESNKKTTKWIQMKQNHGFYSVFLQFQFCDVRKQNVGIFAIFFFEIDQSKKAKRSRGRKSRAEKASPGGLGGFQNGVTVNKH